MSPLTPAQRRRLPLLAAGAAAALGFAVWNIQRAVEPPLRNIPKSGSLDRVSAEVERSLPLPSGEEAPESVAPVPPLALGVKPVAPTRVAEENLSPEANPFIPLPGNGQPGQRFIEASAPRYDPMPQLPPPSYIPSSPALMRLTTAESAAPPQPQPAVGPPLVSVRSTGIPGPVMSAPALPAATPASGAQSTSHPSGEASPAKSDTTPSLVGTLLGDQPSAVFMIDGNIILVPSGGLVTGWKLLAVEHGQVLLKNLATGRKVPVIAAGEVTGSPR